MGHELLFFPDYRAANPYQQLLYDHAGGWLHPRPAPVAEALQLLRQKGLDERVILHLHWEDAVYRTSRRARGLAGGAGVPGRSGAFINAGGRLLWTLHNTALTTRATWPSTRPWSRASPRSPTSSTSLAHGGPASRSGG
jgi:hypothetical protein